MSQSRKIVATIKADYHREAPGISPQSITYEQIAEQRYHAYIPPGMTGSWIIAAAELLLGILLLVVVNNTTGPLILSVLFLVAGLVIHLLPGFRDLYARRAFVLSFCTCVLVMGVAQTYATVFFGELQTTVDSSTFYNLVRPGILGGEDLEQLKSVVNAPLPVVIWRILYTMASPLGNGPYIGILFNSFLIGMAGSITVMGGRHLIGENPRSLCRLGNLFAGCGMFWLFGAIFIRDSFALFINTVVLWACLKVLALPCSKNVVTLGISVVISALCMNYVREGLTPLFILFTFLTIFCWVRRKPGSVLIFLLPLIIVMVGFMLLPLITSHLSVVASSVEQRAINYGSQITDTGHSLGASMVVTQPMPIRIPIGSVYLLVQPIPLWSNFRLYMPEYQWVKGWQGIFLVCIVPSVLVGMIMSIKRAISGGNEAPTHCFVAFYVIITTMAVAATSLETRHHGQFLPAMLMLAALPDKKDPMIYRQFRFAMIGWFGFVIMGHILWAALKAG